jgi:hypothetical protein
MKRFNGLLALVVFLSFGTMSTFAFAGDEEKKDEKKDKGGHVVMFDDEKKDEKTDKGKVVVFGDEKKDEKKDMGGK